MPGKISDYLKCKNIKEIFKKFFETGRRKKTIFGLAIAFVSMIFVACWNWVWYVIVAFAILWEFGGQSIDAKSDRYYYNIGETVNCEITYHVSQTNRYIYVEIVDDVSGVVVASDIISPLIIGGYHTKYFDEYTTTYPGYFKCHAQIKTTGAKSMGWQGSTFYFIVGETGQTYPNTLKLWCGDNIKGNPNEKLRPVYDKNAHYIAVQVEGTDHTAQVHFASEQCTFEYTGADSIESPQHAITINGQTIYIAHTWVKLPPDIPPPGEYLPCIIKAEQEEAPSPVYISVYSITDGEESHNIGTYTHQKNSSDVEILGDNYVSTLDNQGNVVIDPGGENDYKDIVIELDWYKWESSVDTTTIKEIANLIKQILYTAGIDTVNAIFIGNEITNMPDSTTRVQRMSLLAEHKAPLATDEQRIWLNKIHVILGSKGETGQMGITEMYPASGDVNVWQTMHLASGGLDFSAPYLDSVGCFVFAKRILEYPSEY